MKQPTINVTILNSVTKEPMKELGRKNIVQINFASNGKISSVDADLYGDGTDKLRMFDDDFSGTFLSQYKNIKGKIRF